MSLFCVLYVLNVLHLYFYYTNYTLVALPKIMPNALQDVRHPIAFTYLFLSSALRSSHTASASPSSKVGSFVALLSLSHSLALQQMSNFVNHSEMFPDAKGLGKLTWLLTAILCCQ